MRWPDGFTSSAAACGIKGGGVSDLGLLRAAGPAAWAGTFTTNAAAAAPVLWCREQRGSPVQAVVVNSGNANACTGSRGADAVRSTAATAAAALGCAPEEVLVASTGVIGVPLPVELVEASLPAMAGELEPDSGGFARAIMTTDTFPKAARSVAGDAIVAGVAKGAAMLAPNMATMLAFLATDANAGSDQLQTCLQAAVDVTFNRLNVDACQSTNDSVFLLASGTGAPVGDGDLTATLTEVCRDLALKMARDGEGATKVMRVRVQGASDETHAQRLADAVASSVLWRAALHGGDPNWGRILAALGSADPDLDPSAVQLALGSEVLFKQGEPVGSIALAASTLAGDQVTVGIVVGTGSGEAEVLGCDLSEEYVTLNAEATS